MRVLAATPKVQETKVERLKVEEIDTVLATLKDRSGGQPQCLCAESV
jgi:hypothetical protein